MTTRPEYYDLRGTEAVPVECLEDVLYLYRRNGEGLSRCHLFREQVGAYLVSTIFLASDHNYGGDGPPTLFETMVFPDPREEYCERYSTYMEAMAGHAKAVAYVQKLGVSEVQP